VTATTIAVGGGRSVPVPDPIARDYLLLALRLDQHISGLVDGYFGPADLKAQVDLEALANPARLRDEASALRERVDREVPESDRRAWLAAQLVALETQAAALAGDGPGYELLVARCFDWTMERRPDSEFDAAAAELDSMVPGDGPLADRLAAWDRRFEVPRDALQSAVGWLVGVLRERADRLFGLPAGEDLRVGLVSGQPWTAYNWYDGGYRSRVDVNTDLPIRIADLAHLAGHEAYPGHHLEHAWKEAMLVHGLARLESSILLINTPECLISEGLADLGPSVVLADEGEEDLLAELYRRAGNPIADDPADARETARLQVRMSVARRRLGAVAVNAALMRHADGASHEAVAAYLRDVGRMSPERAAKRLEFIEHPLWRTYVFVYSEGEALLRRWLDVMPSADRPARFGRLLREQLTPTAIAAETTTAIARR
jgi:hypothetical protein